MNLEKIQSKIQELQQAEQLIIATQKLWQKKTQKIIYNTLNEITEQVKYKWYIGINDEKINNETVYLVMEDVPSGIRYNSKSALNKEEGFSGPLIKIGGSINFSLLHNGCIISWMSFPFIEDLIPPSDMEVISTYTQDQITVENIQEDVLYFLDKISKWHALIKQETNTIGFKSSVSSGKSNGLNPIGK